MKYTVAARGKFILIIWSFEFSELIVQA